MAAITRNENFIYYDTFWREEGEDEVTQLYSLAYILPYSRFRSKTKEHLGKKYQLLLSVDSPVTECGHPWQAGRAEEEQWPGEQWGAGLQAALAECDQAADNAR